MSFTNLKQHACWYVICFIFLSVAFHSCKKIDTPLQNRDVVERFLQLPANASPQLRRIVQDLRTKNAARPFIEQFVAKVGFPLWKYAKIGKPKSKRNTLARADEEDIVEVPVVSDTQKYVNAILSIKLNTELLYKIFKSKEWESYGFDKDPNRTLPNADDLVAKIMTYEIEIWGGKYYQVYDNRIFDTWPAGFQKPMTFEIEITIVNGKAAKNNACRWMNSSGQWEGAPDPEWQNLVPVFCFPGTTWDADPLGFGDGWSVPDLGDNNGGGSGGGGNSSGPACNPLVPWVKLAVKEGVVWNPCLNAPFQPGSTDLVDENGFLLSRINQLNELFETDPFAIDPCDKLTLMNLATYGPMYQRIAQYTVPDNVVSKLNSIREQQEYWPIDNYNIQSLQNAYGPVVNCDYFPIEITQFPTNTSGIPMTPDEFLEFFRMNINRFITEPVTIRFSCYLSPSLDDCPQWQQPGANALGALNHIYIPGNSGSVILSDYQNIYNANSQQHYFKFTTIESPFDNEHPVAGNREWGLFNNAAGPVNRYTFYSMAVDRTWDWPSAVTNDLFGGFERADQLWSNMQENLINYVNQNGGSAGYYAEKNYIARPKWEDIKDFLMGHISFETLKEKLGCV